MAQAVAERPYFLSKLICHEKRRQVIQLGRSFANAFQATLNCIVGLAVFPKGPQIHSRRITENRLRVLDDV